jgi:P27 family predicted phage terminase small subunit
MARTGRPPKPIEQKRRAGNPGKRALPKPSQMLALAPADKAPPVPMTLQATGRRLWADIWGGPAKVWLARDVDFVRVSTVCHVSDEIATLRNAVVKLGPLLEEPIITPTGVVTGETKVVANPAVKMLRDAEKSLREDLTALGFDPVSRARLGLAEVKRQSILEQLLSGDNRHDQAGEIIEAEVIEIAADD